MGHISEARTSLAPPGGDLRCRWPTAEVTMKKFTQEITN